MGRNKDLIGHLSEKRCPKCGSVCLENKRGDIWCSFIGGNSIPACDYGLIGIDLANGPDRSVISNGRN